MTMQLRKAERKQAKLRVGVSGPSGSGKTYSALLIARGLASSWDKVALIDTENGSGELYSNMGDYNVVNLTAPFTPERYIEAVQTCEKAGMEVIVIDSTSHEWDGKGGCLEINDIIAQTKFRGNTWSAWSVTTPRHQKFIDSIVMSSCHIITTTRSKTDTIQTEDKKIKKVGLKEIQRDGFEYELTINFTLDRDGHYATASKDRTSVFIDKDPFVITEETGKMLAEWSKTGAVIPQSIAKQLATPEQVVKFGNVFRELMELAKFDDEKSINYMKKMLNGRDPGQVSSETLEKHISTLEKKLQDSKIKLNTEKVGLKTETTSAAAKPSNYAIEDVPPPEFDPPEYPL